MHVSKRGVGAACVARRPRFGYNAETSRAAAGASQQVLRRLSIRRRLAVKFGCAHTRQT